jgi:hypothetical protein
MTPDDYGDALQRDPNNADFLSEVYTLFLITGIENIGKL